MKLQIPFSIAAGLSLVLVALFMANPGSILTNAMFGGFLVIMMISLGLFVGIVSKPTIKDWFLTPLVLIISVGLLITMLANSMAQLSWIQVLFAGAAVDLLLWAFGKIKLIPYVGSLILMMIAMTFTGIFVEGFPDFILSSIAAILAFTPIPTMTSLPFPIPVPITTIIFFAIWGWSNFVVYSTGTIVGAIF
jgi:hypothetical protein